MLLKVKSLKFTAGRPVAILNYKTAKKLSIYVGERIRLKNKHEIIAIVDISKKILKENEIALSEEILKKMKISEGYAVEVSAAPRPKSLYYIFEKLNGKTLNCQKIETIIKDTVNNALTESEIAYFISGVYIHGMNDKELISLTKSMVNTGKKIEIKNAVDKHSIGGVAGNRVTPIVIPICSAAGLTMPKTSSRAITSAAGTADVMECFCKVDFSAEEIKKIVKKVNACMVWGGSLNLAPADDKIIQVERVLGLDPEVQLLASILSKKLAIGAKYVLIDIPYGKSAKVDEERAKKLSKKFEKVGKLLGLKLKTILSDGSQPIGNGIGPILEALDVYSVLSQDPNRPSDLEKKSLLISSKILEMTRKAKKGEGLKIASEILKSKKALSQFHKIIEAQGGKDHFKEKLKLAKLSYNIKSNASGKVKEIDNKKIATLALTLGCPADKPSGVYLHVHKDFNVKKGDLLLTLYAETKEKLNYAKKAYSYLRPILIK